MTDRLIEFESKPETTELIEMGPEPAKYGPPPPEVGPPAEPETTELWPPEMAELWLKDGVGGGIMAVIMDTEEGEAISEATGVTDPDPGLLSRPPVVVVEARELAALRLKHDDCSLSVLGYIILILQIFQLCIILHIKRSIKNFIQNRNV